MIIAVDITGVDIGIVRLVFPILAPVSAVAHQTGGKLGDGNFVAVFIREGDGDTVVIGQLTVLGVGDLERVEGAKGTAVFLSGKAEARVGTGSRHL